MSKVLASEGMDKKDFREEYERTVYEKQTSALSHFLLNHSIFFLFLLLCKMERIP